MQISSLLEHMNNLGVVDGVTKEKGQSVDGLPLKVHLDKVQELKNILEDTNLNWKLLLLHTTGHVIYFWLLKKTEIEFLEKSNLNTQTQVHV